MTRRAGRGRLFATGLAMLGVAAVYLAAVIVANRTQNEIVLERLGDAPELALAGADLTVTTWNLGYGGLGAESDFVADGGTSYLPPSREAVEKNIAGIESVSADISSDVVLLQEAAKASFLTRGGDVLAAVARAFAGRDGAFSADFSVRYLPPGLGPRHGLATFVAARGVRREIVSLPKEPGHIMGLSKRLYHLQVLRIPFDGGAWTVIDVHLSAFDDGANVRAEQLRAVLDFAEAEYASGAHVIIGGDWNLEFARPGRATTTGPEFLFWLHPFPLSALAEGWRAAFDPQTPSVRTNERPYRRGENFTTVIDGFVVSPNVEVVAVATRDLDFQFADHQPVTARFRAADR